MVNTKEDTSKNKKIGLWKYLSLYYSVRIAGKKYVDGYIFKVKKTSPIVGNHFYEGYEIINPNTNKVLYRRLKDYGYIDDVHGIPNYTVTSEFFKHNIIDYNNTKLANNKAVEACSEILLRIFKVLGIVGGLCLMIIGFGVAFIFLMLVIPVLIISPICRIFTGRSLISDYCTLIGPIFD